MIRVLIAATALALSACVSDSSQSPTRDAAIVNDADARRLIVGTWYGSYESAEQGVIRFLSRRQSDETYIVEFRIPNEPVQFEKGTWGVEDGVFSTLFQEWTLPMFASGPDAEWFPAEPPIRDSYRILELTDQAFEYEHTETGIRFESRRVADDFSIPAQ